MIWSWLRRQPLFVDVCLFGIVIALTIGGASRHSHPTAGVIIGVVGTLALLARRQHPLAVLVTVTVAACLMAAFGAWLAPFAPAVALYTLAAASQRGHAVLPGAASVIAMSIALASNGPVEFGGDAARVVFLIAAWLLGDVIGSRRAYIAEIEQKAERLEREHQTEARRAVAEEQNRIARELHDIVAHALSVIVIQAAAAGDVFELDPSRAREPIAAIESAARAALGDLRRTLGMLQGPHYQPQPGLAMVDQLVDQVRAAGLHTSLHITGARQPLPAAVDVSAYRIIQEALTNTLKHAHAEQATVRVQYGNDLVIEVRDNGTNATQGNGTGIGLIGMRERVTMLGGTVTTGPVPAGGYLVTAQIPLSKNR